MFFGDGRLARAFDYKTVTTALYSGASSGPCENKKEYSRVEPVLLGRGREGLNRRAPVRPDGMPDGMDVPWLPFNNMRGCKMQDQFERPTPDRTPVPRQVEPNSASSVKIALVDGEETFQTAISVYLGSVGFQVVARDGTDVDALIERLVQDGVSTVLVDTEGGDHVGLSLIDRLRARKIDMPVAFLAQSFDNAAEEIALKAGAVEYLVKSRGPTIMAKRIHLLINGVRANAASAGESDLFEVGTLSLRLESHRALWAENLVSLTVTEFRIVRLLATSHGSGFSYRRIYDVVHGAGFVAGDGPDGFRINVRALIRKIRRKFRDVDPAFDAIENIAGYGYQWRTPNDSASPRLTSNDHEPGTVEGGNVFPDAELPRDEPSLDGEDAWTASRTTTAIPAA